MAGPLGEYVSFLEISSQYGCSPRLTECEPDQLEYDRARINAHEVRFRGVLDIKSLTWLTPEYQKKIEHELRRRDIATRIRNGGKSRSSGLTLSGIYGEGPVHKRRNLTVKVVIQGVKNMTAVYLICKLCRSCYSYTSMRISCGPCAAKLVPNGLQLLSKDRDRLYEVVSMDMATYVPSRVYLARYRMLSIMQDLVGIDARTTSSNGESCTPVDMRTPEWFADLYRTHMAQSASARRRRILHASSDSEIEPDTRGRLKAGHEHILPHVPHAHILSLLATHAEWILAEQRKRQSPRRLIDVDIWERWITKVRKARKEAARNGIQWGIRDEAQLASIDSDADDDEAPVKAPTRKKGKTKRKKQPRSRMSSSRSTTLVGPSRSDDDMSLHRPDPTTLRTYDPDFSPVSTPPASPSSSSASLPSRPSTPPDPAIKALIPSAIMHKPLLTSTDFSWVCPVPHCHYEIDLMNPSEPNCRGLLQEDVKKLRSGNWGLRKKWLRRCFQAMVSTHYEDHLSELGIEFLRDEKNWKGVWKKPQHHPQWPPPRRQATIRVKEEVD
ncbi:hypothetical protein AcW1_000626 [Taiwanofungus camphoratus]|nr:hypothetical protein AcW2_000879 [Antrodia cinnamomea]KAI0963588.1 hypothetical protein AcW1_000626 [Antrodia cinnamomea]